MVPESLRDWGADWDDCLRYHQAGLFDLKQAIYDLSNRGEALLLLEVDQAATQATGRLQHTYKLNSALVVALAAVRAKNLDADNQK